MILAASRTEIDKQLEHGALRYVSHAARSTNAIALDKSRDHLDSFGRASLFMEASVIQYTSIMLERSSIVKLFFNHLRGVLDTTNISIAVKLRLPVE